MLGPVRCRGNMAWALLLLTWHLRVPLKVTTLLHLSVMPGRKKLKMSMKSKVAVPFAGSQAL